MKTTFAVLALMVVCAYAAPASENNILKKADQEMITPMKGEEPLALEERLSETAVYEDVDIKSSGQVWIPFYDFFSGLFSKDESPKTNELKSAKPEPRQRPNRENFEDSGEFLDAENIYHFGESEEEQQLVVVDSDEVRRSPHKAPEHVKDAILYNKVMPKRVDFSDYGDFLEATNRHMMGSPIMHKKSHPKVKSTWNSWFGKW